MRSMFSVLAMISSTALAASDPATWPEYKPSDVQVRKQVPIEPPPGAGALGQSEVRCLVRAFVNSAGKPVRIEVGGCDPFFHGAVEEAVDQWRWTMPMSGGKRVAAQIPMALRFRVPQAREGSLIQRQFEEKTAAVFDEVGDEELDPRVLEIAVPSEGTQVVEGGQPWDAPAITVVNTRAEWPAYPKNAVEAGVYDATCDVRVQIDEKGRPDTITVGGCPEAFARASRTSVQRWRWEPPLSTEDSKPAIARIRFDMVFRAHPDAFYAEDTEDDDAPEEEGPTE
jgi:outer membrane biosynthesis protein TonB